MKKYRTWAFLNAEGKKAWGDVFPDGQVPIQSIIAQTATLEGIDRVERVFLLDWKELTAEQQKSILERISKLSGRRQRRNSQGNSESRFAFSGEVH